MELKQQNVIIYACDMCRRGGAIRGGRGGGSGSIFSQIKIRWEPNLLPCHRWGGTEWTSLPKNAEHLHL